MRGLLVESSLCLIAAGAESRVCQDYLKQEEELLRTLMTEKLTQTRKKSANISISRLVALEELPTPMAGLQRKFITTVSSMLKEIPWALCNSQEIGISKTGHQVKYVSKVELTTMWPSVMLQKAVLINLASQPELMLPHIQTGNQRICLSIERSLKPISKA